MARTATTETVENTTANAVNVATNWKAFIEAGLVPDGVECNAYRPFHPKDFSCHTKLPVNAAALLPHIDEMHSSGGGFLIKVRKARAKEKPEVTSFWSDLEKFGIEALDLRCSHCDGNTCKVCTQTGKISSGRLLVMLKPHAGNNRRREAPGVLGVTLSHGLPEPTDEELED